MAFTNPGPDEICRLLRDIRTIAVVGLSPNPSRPSFRVARGMQSYGYRIVPVRPLIPEVLGEKAYPDLESVPFKVDMVDVFRASEHVPAIVASCIGLGIPRLWLQEGVVHEKAAQLALASGITVVMITHNLDLVRHATRALKVEGGRLIPVDIAGSGSIRSVCRGGYR